MSNPPVLVHSVSFSPFLVFIRHLLLVKTDGPSELSMATTAPVRTHGRCGGRTALDGAGGALARDLMVLFGRSRLQDQMNPIILYNYIRILH